MAKMIVGQLFSGNPNIQTKLIFSSFESELPTLPLFPQIPEFEGDLSADFWCTDNLHFYTAKRKAILLSFSDILV